MSFSEEISEPCAEGCGVTIDDFRAYMPAHSYIFMPCCEFWPAASVNSRLPPVPVLDEHGQPKRIRTASSSRSPPANGSIRTAPSSR